MLFFRVFRSVIRQDQLPVFASLREELSGQFRPVLAPTLAATSNILNAPPKELRNDLQIARFEVEPRTLVIDGEIFTDGTNLISMHITDDARRRIRLGIIDETGGREQVIGLTVSLVGQTFEPDALRLVMDRIEKTLEIVLKPYTYPSERFEELKKEGRTSAAVPSMEELEPAQLLADRSVRTLAIAIKSSGGLLVRDLPKQLPLEAQDKIEWITASLRTARLIESEVVAVCSKTQAQVARAPSREVLVELSDKGVKCACGRPLASERLEEALSITEIGRTLLDKTRWLTVLLFLELRDAGINEDAIVIEQTLGGDEIDCLANIGGELALFELKDKEFNLGNAYSFGAKIGIIRPNHPIIVTTERVGNDAKEHFARAQGARPRRGVRYADQDEGGNPITFIEGVESLPLKIQKLVSDINRTDGARLLDSVVSIAHVGGAGLVRAIEKSKSCVPDDENGPSESDSSLEENGTR